MNKHLIILFLIISLGLAPIIATAGSLNQEICPCSEAVYSFKLQNSQDSAVEYSFSVDEFSEQTKFSANPALISPGETKIVYAYITPECDLTGNYEFNFLIKSQGKRIKLPASLNISLCSDFGIAFGELLDLEEELKFEYHEGIYKVCKGDIRKIPVLIINKGNLSNNFFFALNGDFAELSQGSAVLKENQKGVIYLNLEPDSVGEYSLFLDVIKEKGAVKKAYKIDLEVEECYKLAVDIEKGLDKVCGGERAEYDVSIANEGVFDESFSLSSNVDWAGFDNDVIDIEAGKEATVKLILAPLIDDSGSYDIEVIAGIKGTNVEAGDSVNVGVTAKESCYNVRITANDRYSLDYFGERIHIKIKNIGTKEADFDIKLEGLDWVSISQDKVSLSQGEAKKLNIFAKPGEDIEVGAYDISVTVTKDDISYSKDIKLELVKRGELFSKIKLYSDYYIYYVIVGIVLLIGLLVLITLVRWAIKKIPPKKPKKVKQEQKKQEVIKEVKKVEKKVVKSKVIKKENIKIIPFLKSAGIVLLALVIIAAIIYLFYKFKLFDYIKFYIPFIGAGLGLLIVLVLIIHFRRKRPKKKKTKKVKEKEPKKKEIKEEKKEEIKKVEKEVKKDVKERLHIVEFIEYIIILIILGAVVYFISKIEGIGSEVMYYLNYVVLGFAVLVILVMILNKFRRIKGGKKKEKKVKVKTEIKKLQRKK